MEKLKAENAKLRAKSSSRPQLAEEGAEDDGDDEPSLQALQEIHALLEKSFGKDHPDTLSYRDRIAQQKRNKQESKPLPARLQIAHRELEKKTRTWETATKAVTDATAKLAQAQEHLQRAALAKEDAEQKIKAVQQEVAASSAQPPPAPASLEALLPGGVALEGEHLERMQALEAQWSEFLGALPKSPAPDSPAPTASQCDMETDEVEVEKKVAESIDSLLAAACSASAGSDMGAARTAALKRIAEAQRESLAKRTRMPTKCSPAAAGLLQSSG